MDLFQILIILFILFPLLQRLLGGGKKQERNQQRQQRGQTERRDTWQQQDQRAASSDNWDEALRELESIFTGEPVQKSPPAEPGSDTSVATSGTPSPAPTRTTDRSVPGTSGNRNTRTSRAEPATRESPALRRQRELQERFERSSRRGSILDAMEDDDNNPIFQSIDQPVEIDDEGRDYSAQAINKFGLDDPEELKRHLIIKEILDKPLSKRGRRHHLPV